MKKILKINLIMILLNIILFAQQNQTTSCYVEAEASNSYEEIQNAIVTNTTYTELVIIARDSGVTPTIPTWFTNIINDAPTYFSKATFGKLDYNIQVLQNGSNTFNFAFGDTVLWSGGCNHVHSERNVIDLLTQADAVYNYKDFDFDNDDRVYIHVMSIGPKSGGVGNACWTYTSQDSGVTDLIDVIVKAQTRGSRPSLFENAFYHETGHDLFSFPDMDHSGIWYYNHYSLGGFEIMSSTGFQGVPSLYNPFFRHDRNWFEPVEITSSMANVEMKDFQKEKRCYVYIPTSLSSDAFAHQRFYVSYHRATDQFDNRYYHTWPYKDKDVGGVLIWHTKTDTVKLYDSYSDWRRMDVDLESAHGKYNWNETADSVHNNYVANPLKGRDSLEIRKTVNGTEIQGPYFGKDHGSKTIFYSPDDGKDFTAFSNPNSNWINKNYSESYAQNIVSGFSVKNLRTQSGKVYVDFVLNDFTVNENKTLSKGKWQIENTITVASGVTLTFNEGTTLIFKNNSSLVVNGTLNIQGTSSNKVIVDFITPNSSNGIKIYPGGSADIKYTEIKNAYYGVYDNEAELEISNSIIKDCLYGLYLYRTNYTSSQIQPHITNCDIYKTSYNGSGTGIYCNYSSPIILNTNISNYYTGIGIIYNSSPLLGHYTANGNNSLHNNYKNLHAISNSNPFLGTTSYGGYNTFKNYTYKNLIAQTNCNIYAENNYWGSTNSSTIASGISIYSGCSVDYVPFITWDTNGSTKQSINSLKKSSSNDLNTNNEEIRNIQNQIQIGNLEEALTECNELLTKNIDESTTLIVIDLMWQIERKMKENKNNTTTDVFAEIRNKEENDLSKCYVNLIDANGKNSDERISSLDNVLLKSDKIGTIEEAVLYAKILYYYNEEMNLEKAKEQYKILAKKYPDSPITKEVLYYIEGNGKNGNLDKGNNSLRENLTDISQTYELFSNYPNPFNPSTTISYQIKETGNVRIKIYDALGREITTLVNEVKQPGNYSVTFDADNHSSGIYFVRMQANEYSSTRKIILAK